MATDSDVAISLGYRSDHIDIYSCSWGPSDWGFEIVGPGLLTQRVLQIGAEKVRNSVSLFFHFLT